MHKIRVFTTKLWQWLGYRTARGSTSLTLLFDHLLHKCDSKSNARRECSLGLVVLQPLWWCCID